MLGILERAVEIVGILAGALERLAILAVARNTGNHRFGDAKDLRKGFGNKT